MGERQATVQTATALVSLREAQLSLRGWWKGGGRPAGGPPPLLRTLPRCTPSLFGQTSTQERRVEELETLVEADSGPR